MALNGYVKIGDFTKGASTSKSIGQLASTSSDYQDQSTVVAFTFGCAIPMDPTSGVPTGARQYQSCMITTLLDSAAPQLANLMSPQSTKAIDEIDLSLFRPDASGTNKPENYFKIVLKKCNLVKYEIGMDSTFSSPQSPVTISYWYAFKQMQVDHTVSGTTGSDNY